MAALARDRARLLLIVPALLCLALVAGGCRLLEEDGTSRVPGVELVEQQGAAVAAWSADSRRIAVPVPGGIGVRRNGEASVRVIEAPPLRGYRPGPIEWSGPGRFLRYATTVGPNREHRLWSTVIFPDGSGLEQTPLLSELEGEAEEAVLSPNSRLVLFQRSAHGRSELWVANADGTDPRRLARFLTLRGYRFSPDGREVAFAAGGASGGLYVVPVAGGKPRAVTYETPAGGPTWTPDGRRLTYSTFDGEVKRIRRDGKGSETIAAFGEREEVRGLTWSPNGRYLLYSLRPFPSAYD